MLTSEFLAFPTYYVTEGDNMMLAWHFRNLLSAIPYHSLTRQFVDSSTVPRIHSATASAN